MALWIGTSVDENFWQGWNRKVKTNVDDNGYAQATYGAGDISTNNPDYPVEAGWIDVESGSQIALVNDGNWRQPESSKFKLLLRTGHGEARGFAPIRRLQRSPTHVRSPSSPWRAAPTWPRNHRRIALRKRSNRLLKNELRPRSG